jgi:hypothetical protein
MGTVGVLMAGVAAAAGVLALVVAFFRRPRVTRYALPRALRLLGLRRFPVVGLIVVWALLVAVLDPGGYHDARRTDAGPAADPPTLTDAYVRWRAAHAGEDARAAEPMVLVAAQGGGIRAAVWTALVMECLFGPSTVTGGEGVCANESVPATTVRTEPLPVFLGSGASGGSVGLAAWSARRVDLAAGGIIVPDRIDDILAADYLAPDVARILTGDALHLLLAQNSPDRAEMLERSWERSWGTDSGGGLGRGMRTAFDLATANDGWRMPVLALNGAQVQDGCRFVSSPVDFVVPRNPADPYPVTSASDLPSDDCDGRTGPALDALPRSTELIDYLCPGQDVPFSTMGHLSARFPFVSPTGRVDTGDCHGIHAVTSVLDGGIGDNSGAATAVQTWRALQPAIAEAEQQGQRCVVPVFLQVDNSPDATSDASTSPPLELLAPGQALLSNFGNREAAERAEAEDQFSSLRTASGHSYLQDDNLRARIGYFRIAPAVQPGAEPPLGWTLSASTVEQMRHQLLSSANKYAIQRLRDLIAHPPACPTTG